MRWELLFMAPEKEKWKFRVVQEFSEFAQGRGIGSFRNQDSRLCLPDARCELSTTVSEGSPYRRHSQPWEWLPLEVCVQGRSGKGGAALRKKVGER